MQSTWDYVLDAWPDEAEIEIPAPPLSSVTSITYKDTGGIVNTLNSSSYVVATESEPGRIVLMPGAAWPSAELWPVSAIKIRFVAGVVHGCQCATIHQAGHAADDRRLVREQRSYW